jgi:hypothetical protein
LVWLAIKKSAVRGLLDGSTVTVVPETVMGLAEARSQVAA